MKRKDKKTKENERGEKRKKLHNPTHPYLDRPVCGARREPLVRDRVDRQRPHPPQVARHHAVAAPVRVPLGPRPLGWHPPRELVERRRRRGSRGRSLRRWRCRSRRGVEGDDGRGSSGLLLRPLCCCPLLPGDEVDDAARGRLRRRSGSRFCRHRRLCRCRCCRFALAEHASHRRGGLLPVPEDVPGRGELVADLLFLE